ILEGASSLLSGGTPLVLEWNPSHLDRVGSRDKVQEAIVASYTHFANMHRNPDPRQPGYSLQTVDRLPGYAERSNLSNKTDILLVRLDPGDAEGVPTLDAILSRRAVDDEDEMVVDELERPGGA